MVKPRINNVSMIGVSTTLNGGNRKGMCVIGKLFQWLLATYRGAREVTGG